MTGPPAPSIVITVSPAAVTSPDITELVQAVKGRIHDHDVRVESPPPPEPPALPQPPVDTGRKSQRVGSSEFDALATIAVSVPWEALTGAVATVVLEAIRDWTAKRVIQQKLVLRERSEQAAEQVKAQRTPLRKLQDRLRPKPSAPETPSLSDIHLGFRRVPRVEQVVNIYGPRGQLLAVVQQNKWQESPSVDFGPPPS